VAVQVGKKGGGGGFPLLCDKIVENFKAWRISESVTQDFAVKPFSCSCSQHCVLQHPATGSKVVSSHSLLAKYSFSALHSQEDANVTALWPYSPQFSFTLRVLLFSFSILTLSTILFFHILIFINSSLTPSCFYLLSQTPFVPSYFFFRTSWPESRVKDRVVWISEQPETVDLNNNRFTFMITTRCFLGGKKRMFKYYLHQSFKFESAKHRRPIQIWGKLITPRRKFERRCHSYNGIYAHTYKRDTSCGKQTALRGNYKRPRNGI
jgi:hypothetical protein